MIIKENWIAGDVLLTYDMPVDDSDKDSVRVHHRHIKQRRESANKFPTQLHELHHGSIALNSNSKYLRRSGNLSFKCMNCTHEWSTSANNVINSKSGCPKCAQKRVQKLNTNRKHEQHSEEARKKAVKKYHQVLNYSQVAKEYGVAKTTLMQ